MMVGRWNGAEMNDEGKGGKGKVEGGERREGRKGKGSIYLNGLIKTSSRGNEYL